MKASCDEPDQSIYIVKRYLYEYVINSGELLLTTALKKSISSESLFHWKSIFSEFLFRRLRSSENDSKFTERFR